jgi:hypothetical protein
VSVSQSVVDKPGERFEVAPDRCARCEESLDNAVDTVWVLRQVVDVDPHHRKPASATLPDVAEAMVEPLLAWGYHRCPRRDDDGHTAGGSVSRAVAEEPLGHCLVHRRGRGELRSWLQARRFGQRVGQVCHRRELDVVGLRVPLA